MLAIKNLAVSFKTRRGEVDAVRGINLEVARGETLGIVGESGSGKSVTAFAVMRLLDAGGAIRAGKIVFDGLDLRQAAEHQMRDIRGREISMIFQNPRAALNPIRKIGHQIEDVLLRHARATRATARNKAIEALEQVRISNAELRYQAYPFELSGGMCQRVVIAMALACDPRLLIADEPTTGLDITTQKMVMDLTADLIRERKMSAILITHDLGLAAHYADRIAVMKDGRIVEIGGPTSLFARPAHAYTRKLVDATPREGASIRSLLPLEQRTPLETRRTSERIALAVEGLTKTFVSKSGPIHAVKDISFSIGEGETVGLVGESGSGKSTTSSMIARLLDPSSGTIRFRGKDIGAVPSHAFAGHPLRASIQMVFQDASDSLNPRHTARQTIEQPLRRLSPLGHAARQARIGELADLVGLPQPLLERLPHQLSGGQKARVGIARAIALDPAFLILDEPTAALDVSIQAVVLNLLIDLQAKLDMTYLFVSHDLHVVRLLCDRVIVMQGGGIVEQGPTETVMNAPQSAYTRALIDAAPKPPTIAQDHTDAMKDAS